MRDLGFLPPVEMTEGATATLFSRLRHTSTRGGNRWGLRNSDRWDRKDEKTLLRFFFSRFSSLIFLPGASQANPAAREGNGKKPSKPLRKGQLTIYNWGSPLILEAGIFQKAPYALWSLPF